MKAKRRRAGGRVEPHFPVASSTECTGLVAALPETPAEWEALEDLERIHPPAQDDA